MKNVLILCVFLMTQNLILGLDFSNPMQQGGWFNQHAVLRIIEPYGFVLGSSRGIGTYMFRYQSKSPQHEWNFILHYSGKLGIRTSAGLEASQQVNLNSSDSVSIETLTINLKTPVRYLELQFEIADLDSFLISAKPQFPTVTNEDLLLYSPQGSWSSDNRDLKFPMPVGVNLEAEYVFRELGIIERQVLLRQIRSDGFNSIRLHKLMDACQAPRFSGCTKVFLRSVERFLQQAVDLGLSLSLDILSNPEDGGIHEGWKGEIFLNPKLQDRLKEWVLQLHGLKVDGRSLLSHPSLQQVVLFNENSLFYETAPEVKAQLWKSYLGEIRRSPYVSLRAYAENKMLSFGFDLEKLLRKLGYLGSLFFSNYQASGRDLELNHFFGNGLLDRHFYIDYPRFSQGAVKVKNISPVLKHKQLFEEYATLTQKGPIFISEFNLPWPNRYQHELLPFLLSLHAIKPLRGVWFYDYRLRTTQFHKGGIFGIQKFRSIIMQLPWLEKALRYPLKLKSGSEYLMVEAGPYTMKSGHFPNSPYDYSVTCWGHAQGTQECFSFEKALGDSFDNMGTMQFQFGQEPVSVEFPEASFSF